MNKKIMAVKIIPESTITCPVCRHDDRRKMLLNKLTDDRFSLYESDAEGYTGNRALYSFTHRMKNP